MAVDPEVHSSLIAWHNSMLGERIFGTLWAIQIIMSLLGRYGLFWTTYGPKTWIPNLALKILYAKCSGTPCISFPSHAGKARKTEYRIEINFSWPQFRVFLYKSEWCIWSLFAICHFHIIWYYHPLMFNNQKSCLSNLVESSFLGKGSHRVRKVQFFWTLFKRPLTPPPFVWTSCGEFFLKEF